MLSVPSSRLLTYICSLLNFFFPSSVHTWLMTFKDVYWLRPIAIFLKTSFECKNKTKSASLHAIFHKMQTSPRRVEGEKSCIMMHEQILVKAKKVRIWVLHDFVQALNIYRGLLTSSHMHKKPPNLDWTQRNWASIFQPTCLMRTSSQKKKRQHHYLVYIHSYHFMANLESFIIIFLPQRIRTFWAVVACWRQLVRIDEELAKLASIKWAKWCLPFHQW